ncbi:MAG: aminoacyl-tRNA hydrolase [Clostridiales bacterium]|nr:aminoacyl-tRNA hydrolase [Clostridiales bacterium]
MYLIVGLGNPGLSYRKTRHNAGFLALDKLAELARISIKKKQFSSLTGEGTVDGKKVLLLKPQTYMNLSGDAVGQALRYYQIPPENLIVLYDDVALPVGALRVRGHGSGGSHNGMRSILAHLGTENFPRVRIGVGQDTSLQLRDYVLKRPGKDEQKILATTYDRAAEAVTLILAGKLDAAQAKFNSK